MAGMARQRLRQHQLQLDQECQQMTLMLHSGDHQQQQQLAEQGYHEQKVELRDLEQLCSQLDEAAAAQAQDQVQQQQQQQQQQAASATEERGAQPESSAEPVRLLHLYGFVIERTEQPSHELMGPLGVPIYDASPSQHHQQAGESSTSTAQPPPCPWPKPPAGTPVSRAASASQQTAPMAVDGSEQQQGSGQADGGAWFTNGNADEVEPGWWVCLFEIKAQGLKKQCFQCAVLDVSVYYLLRHTQHHLMQFACLCRRFHGSCAGPAFGHAHTSWLHPYGMLLHQVLPAAALPPFR